MTITGIDQATCTKCMECVKDCPAILFAKGDDGKIIFSDPNSWCILCGHCIAACPVDAVQHDKMGDEATYIDGVERPETIATYDTVFNLLRANRSVRRYKDQPVSLTELRKVIEAIRYYPSSSNIRSFKIRVISGRETIEDLSAKVVDVLLQNPALKLTYGDKLSARKAAGKDPIFHGAPHVLVLHSSVDMDMEGNNGGIALTYAQLAAQALGLGTCWIGLAQVAINADKVLAKAAGIRGKTWGILTIGYPTVTYHRCPPRAPLPVKGLD